MDFSIFKNFPIKENVYLQFRPNSLISPIIQPSTLQIFKATALLVSLIDYSSTFGEIGSTRTNPYDARQIQFALKFYF